MQQRLAKDDNLIYKVIESLGFEYIRDRGGYFQFPNLDGDNKTAITLYKDTLKYINYTRGENGNIFTLVMSVRNCNFPEALNYVANKTGLRNCNCEIQYPFGGFYKQLIRNNKYPEVNMLTYDPSVLTQYEGIYSKFFLDDGIDLKTQENFRVGFDITSSRITIPQWNVQGELVGIMGRLNSSKANSEDRWFPIIPCSRGYTLFGYHQNYDNIQQKQTCFIFESEKSVMQMASMGRRNAIATCGCNITSTQARYIKSLLPKKIVIGFDEGLDEEHLREEASKLVISNSICKNKVGYILDRDGEILKPGTKDSPTDNGVRNFEHLVKNNIVWIN